MMKKTECPFEPDLIHAVQNNDWNENLRQHVAACRQCSEALHIVQAMSTVVQETISREHSMPGGKFIYLQALYARKQERLTVLDILALIGMSLIGVTGFIVLFSWKMPGLFSEVFRMTIPSFQEWSYVVPVIAPIVVFVGFIIFMMVMLRDSKNGYFLRR